MAEHIDIAWPMHLIKHRLLIVVLTKQIVVCYILIAILRKGDFLAGNVSALLNLLFLSLFSKM